MWQTAITGLVGLLGLAGVIYTQRRADGREDQRWQRERVAERERWLREDALRSYDHRREALMAFLLEFQRMENVVAQLEIRYGSLFGAEEPPEDFLIEIYDLLAAVRVFGSEMAWMAGKEAADALFKLVFAKGGSWADVNERKQAYLDQIRKDLLVKDG